MTVDELARDYAENEWHDPFFQARSAVAFKAGHQSACERIAKLIESRIDSMGDSACNRKLLELAEGVRSGQ